MKPRRSQRPGFHTTAPTFGATPSAGHHAATPLSPTFGPPPLRQRPSGPTLFLGLDPYVPQFYHISYFSVLVHFLLFLFLVILSILKFSLFFVCFMNLFDFFEFLIFDIFCFFQVGREEEGKTKPKLV